MEYKQKEEESSGDLKMLKRILKGAFGLAATGRSVGRSAVRPFTEIATSMSGS